MAAILEPGDLGGSQRERILNGLAQSIRDRGLPATQITHIVANARTSRSTFYKCFEDKDSCFFELVRIVTTIGLAEVENAVDSTASWRDQVQVAIGTYFDLLGVDPALTVAWSRDLAGLGPQGVAVQQEGVERYADLMRRISGRAVMRRAGVRQLTMAAAVMLVAGINAMVVRSIELGETDLARLAPTAVSIVTATLEP